MGLGIGRGLKKATGGIAGGFSRSLGGLFGSSTPQSVAAATPGFSSAGLSGSFNQDTGSFDVTRSGGLNSLLNNITGRSDQLAGDLGGLLSRVAPGASELRSSRLAGIENRRRRSIGNLRDNLSRRRIAGSSFGADAVTRSELAFEQEADRVRAESTMTELEATTNLLNQQAQAQLQGMNAILSQMNIEASLGANLATSTAAAINSANQFNAQLAQQSADADAAAMGGLGSLAGTLLTAGGDSVIGGLLS